MTDEEGYRVLADIFDAADNPNTAIRFREPDLRQDWMPKALEILKRAMAPEITSSYIPIVTLPPSIMPRPDHTFEMTPAPGFQFRVDRDGTIRHEPVTVDEFAGAGGMK